MRTIKTQLFLVLMAMSVTGAIYAQEKKSQAFWVHEDVVKPSMVAEYEAVCKELTDNMKKYKIQEMNGIVSNTSDNRYLWVSPIENMAQIDIPIFATLSQKWEKIK